MTALESPRTSSGRRSHDAHTALSPERWARRAPLLPALVFALLLSQVPLVITAVVSLLNWNALYPNDIHFIGLDNYIRVFTDEELRSGIVVSIVTTAAVVAISTVLGLAAALLLDRQFRGRLVVRTLFILPFLLVPVASALVWKNLILNHDYGLINQALRGLLGADAPQPDWLTSFPLGAICAALIWQWTPFMMLIMLAGLQGRPLDIEEAARVDGASAWQIFRYLTLPHLRRYIELSALLGGLFIIQNFDAVTAMTAGAFGTANMPFLVYQGFFQAADYGEAAATGIVISVASLLLAVFVLRTASTLLTEDKN